MSFCIKNVKKFFCDHPHIPLDKKKVIKMAKQKSYWGVLSGAEIKPLFGDFSWIFELTITTSPEHDLILKKAMGRMEMLKFLDFYKPFLRWLGKKIKK